MMATMEREQVLLCSGCLGDWSPEHRSHGEPIDSAELVERWRVTLE